MDDADLIKRLQLRQEGAYRELVEQYQAMLFNTCFGFLHNTEEAEDVAQEVFIKVFKVIDTFRGEAKLSTWLYRIALNMSLNKIRARKSKLFVALDSIFDGSYKMEPHSFTPYDSLENKEKANVLHKALDKLPGNQKIAFVLSKYRGLPYIEIAEVMGVTVSSVEALLHRAKKNLQKDLIKYYK